MTILQAIGWSVLVVVVAAWFAILATGVTHPVEEEHEFGEVLWARFVMLVLTGLLTIGGLWCILQ